MKVLRGNVVVFAVAGKAVVVPLASDPTRPLSQSEICIRVVNELRASDPRKIQDTFCSRTRYRESSHRLVSSLPGRNSSPCGDRCKCRYRRGEDRSEA